MSNLFLRADGTFAQVKGSDLDLSSPPFFVTAPLVVGDGTNVDHSGGSQVLISRNFNPGAGNAHSFSDSSIVNWTSSGFGSCAYDDETIIQGSANPLHHASFQAFPQFSGSGTMGALLGFNWAPVINSGTITLVECLSLQGITMNGGTVGTVYGMLIGGLRSTGTLPGDRGILTAAGITNELRGNTILSGGISMATVSLTLANGLNSNIAMPGSMRANVVGPTGAFSVGGIVAGADGQREHIYNTTGQTMTIVNEDASSSPGNRIKTLTGANVVLRANATSFATLVYDGLTSLRWILESTN